MTESAPPSAFAGEPSTLTPASSVRSLPTGDPGMEVDGVDGSSVVGVDSDGGIRPLG
eukprot:CAMPEP_0172748494 /NCGR_PEP_ID=MMETSP1074-20121228/145170_1 /TAXON_ID=2916 /ORGANISM="Ceratium fusus, Strain PA161109" /LENGTH=56 /DNA_ID=CAMNT_0013580235 /DNA_START=144 /DNA_END=314 /DNA_ORIENTATION=-